VAFAKLDRTRNPQTVCVRHKAPKGGCFYPPGRRARSAAPLGCLAAPRLLASGHQPLGLACRLAYVPQLLCTCQVLVCLLRAPPTGGTHSASRTQQVQCTWLAAHVRAGGRV
jgi:hypothetical protein